MGYKPPGTVCDSTDCKVKVANELPFPLLLAGSIMTIRAAWKRKRQSSQTQATIVPMDGSQNQTPSESDTVTTVPNGSPNEQQATTVPAADRSIPGRVRVGMQIAATIQRIERDLIELKRQLRRLPWDKIDQ